MYDNLITPEEIKMLRAGAKTIRPEMVMEALAEGKVVPVVPLHLKSGYMVFHKNRGGQMPEINTTKKEKHRARQLPPPKGRGMFCEERE